MFVAGNEHQPDQLLLHVARIRFVCGLCRIFRQGAGRGDTSERGWKLSASPASVGRALHV